ncbi:hypothetical protein [Protaetiibacter sp. SSC-01]|nr:hypothetical protein [Protaetiibacter sp. SSC-01]
MNETNVSREEVDITAQRIFEECVAIFGDDYAWKAPAVPARFET